MQIKLLSISRKCSFSLATQNTRVKWRCFKLVFLFGNENSRLCLLSYLLLAHFPLWTSNRCYLHDILCKSVGEKVFNARHLFRKQIKSISQGGVSECINQKGVYWEVREDQTFLQISCSNNNSFPSSAPHVNIHLYEAGACGIDGVTGVPFNDPFKVGFSGTDTKNRPAFGI